MKIELNSDTIPDELYNLLLRNFVNKVAELELPLTGRCRFENWTISCEFKPPLQ